MNNAIYNSYTHSFLQNYAYILALIVLSYQIDKRIYSNKRFTKEASKMHNVIIGSHNMEYLFHLVANLLTSIITYSVNYKVCFY